MSSRRPRTGLPPETGTPTPQVSTPSPSYGHDHSFTLQAVMEMHKSIGELKSSVDGLNATVQGIKSKVEDLVGWKNRILGGAIALGAICTLLGFGISKFSQYVTISTPQAAPAYERPHQPLEQKPPAPSDKRQ